MKTFVGVGWWTAAGCMKTGQWTVDSGHPPSASADAGCPGRRLSPGDTAPPARVVSGRWSVSTRAVGATPIQRPAAAHELGWRPPPAPPPAPAAFFGQFSQQFTAVIAGPQDVFAVVDKQVTPFHLPVIIVLLGRCSRFITGSLSGARRFAGERDPRGSFRAPELEPAAAGKKLSSRLVIGICTR